MKFSILYCRIVLTSVLVILCTLTSIGQKSKRNKKGEKKTEIANLINTRNYVFEAQRVLPLGGRQVNLTSAYDLTVSRDTIVSYLPFFGRAYVAPTNPNDGGIKFTSTSYSYNVKERQKGGWEITILPNDTKDVRQMYLSVSPDGYATLNVISNNRGAISYNGIVKAKRKK